MAKNQSTPLTDTPAYKLTNAIYRWFAVSMLWMLCSLPVVTMGAATAAAVGEFSDPENYYSHKLIREFFRRFRACFFRMTALWVLILLLGGLLVLDVSFYRHFAASSGWLIPAVAVILGNLLLGLFRFGCYTAVTAQVCNFRAFLKLAGKTMLMCLPVWAVMVAIDLAMVTTLVRIPYLLFLLVLIPGLCADVHCKLIQMFLRRYESENA